MPSDRSFNRTGDSLCLAYLFAFSPRGQSMCCWSIPTFGRLAWRPSDPVDDVTARCSRTGASIIPSAAFSLSSLIATVIAQFRRRWSSTECVP